MTSSPLPDHDAVFADLHARLARVKPLLRPVTAADIHERLTRFRERLTLLAQASAPAPPPLLSAPQGLPRPLNPFFFARQRRTR